MGHDTWRGWRGVLESEVSLTFFLEAIISQFFCVCVGYGDNRENQSLIPRGEEHDLFWKRNSPGVKQTLSHTHIPVVNPVLPASVVG